MGGHALSTVSVRLTKKNFDRMATEGVSKLRALFPKNRIEALGSYRAKADFGDCDILCESTGFDPVKAAAALDAVEVVRNGPVTSLGVLVRPEVPHRDGNMFQIDLISIDANSFGFALGYFGSSDLGNLVGRIGHAQGLAVRHDGLYYYFRDGDYKFKEILLTQDYAKALTFLGYDSERFEAGFETLEDIFSFAASTPYFNKDIFLLENRNTISRTRDRKRPTYMGFLKWCESRDDLPSFVYPKDKSAWLPRIIAHFPAFEREYNETVVALFEQREMKAKFNGELVSQVTGLQGKELGTFMMRFKSSFADSSELKNFVLQSSPEVIRRRISEFCETTN